MLATLILLAALSAPAQFPVCTPTWVAEFYDAVLVLHEPCDACGNSHTRLFFIRDGKRFADRLLTEEMLLTTDGELFCLAWSDWSQCERLVYFRELCVLQGEYEDVTANQPWFAQGRAMVDLAMPVEAAP